MDENRSGRKCGRSCETVEKTDRLQLSERKIV